MPSPKCFHIAHLLVMFPFLAFGFKVYHNKAEYVTQRCSTFEQTQSIKKKHSTYFRYLGIFENFFISGLVKTSLYIFIILFNIFIFGFFSVILNLE